MVKLVNFVVLLCFPILSIALSSIALLGPTGDGKSSSGNAFVQVLGHETTDVFVEGSSIHSETKIPPAPRPPLYTPQSSLEAMQQHNEDTVLQIKQWVEKLPALDVSDAKPGEYVVTQERKREAAELKRQHDEAINPDKTTNNCRERELRRRGGETDSYGSRCYGPVGPEKYKDYWQDVDYVRECQTTYYKNSGGQHSQSAWISTGEYTKQEGRWTKNMC